MMTSDFGLILLKNGMMHDICDKLVNEVMLGTYMFCKIKKEMS